MNNSHESGELMMFTTTLPVSSIHRKNLFRNECPKWLTLKVDIPKREKHLFAKWSETS